MQELIRVGLVGYGYAAKTFHAPLIAATAGLQLTAVSSSDPAKVHADRPDLEVEASPQALFARDDIDLVIIPTPNDTHFPLAQAALAAGKHVVVDKPFTVTVAEAQQLEAQAQAAGKLLSVFHNRRWDADFLTLQGLLGQRALGRIVQFESHFDRYRPLVPVRWRESAATAGTGLWYDLGPHLIDQALQLFGLPQGIQLTLETLRDGAEVDDYFHALLRYERLQVVLHASTLTPQPAPRFSVHGTEGSYIKHGLDEQEAALKAGTYPPSDHWGVDPVKGQFTAWRDGEPRTVPVPNQRGDYPAYYAALRAAIRGEAPNPVPAREAIQVMQLIEAGRVSAAERHEVALASQPRKTA
jgi:predicted dehydrogenase